MLGTLALVFFDSKFKVMLTVQAYNRAFIFLAVVTVSGILLASTLGFTSAKHDNRQALIVNSAVQTVPEFTDCDY